MIFKHPAGHRPDIEGLRAIAVLAVLLFHLGVTGFAGGYVGVDVFFVISGFLITRNIIDGLEKGRFSLTTFYLSRARRLLPALLVTSALTFALSAAVMPLKDFRTLAAATIAAPFGVSNILFWLQSGYFDALAVTKPLLHTWSLSVEIQFYLLWPFVLIWLHAARRYRWHLAAALAGALVALLVLTELVLPARAETFFYLAPFRMIEFAIGAACNLRPSAGWPTMAPRPRQLTVEAIYAAGLAAVMISVTCFTAGTTFPGLNALVPCLGTAAMILAGNAARLARFTRDARVQFIGRISYSLYLVHWPIVILYRYWTLGPLDAQLGAAETIGLAATSLAAGWALFSLIEDPMRRGGVDLSVSSFRRLAVWMGASLLALDLLAAHAFIGGGWRWRIRDAAPPDPQIAAAIKLGACRGDAGLCAKSGSPVVMMGDSHSDHFRQPIGHMLAELGIAGRQETTAPGCAPVFGAWRVHASNGQPVSGECRAALGQWEAAALAASARVVILAGNWLNGITGVEGDRYAGSGRPWTPDPEASRRLFDEALQRSVEKIVAAGKAVVILGMGPYLDRSPLECFERPALLAKPDCKSRIGIRFPESHAFVDGVFGRIVRAHAGRAYYFDTMRILCPESRCRLAEGAIPFLSDSNHLSPYGALWLKKHHFGPLSQFVKTWSAPPARKDAPTGLSALPK